jgi:hypothetical protein
MTDLEMTRLCAEAMFDPLEWEQRLFDYDPLHDDAQAMALVKKFGLTCDPANDVPPYAPWRVCALPVGGEDWNDIVNADSDDLNRAIVECIAKMHRAIGDGKA